MVDSGGVFFIPPEYYGLGGLSAGIDKGLQGFLGVRNEQDKRKQQRHIELLTNLDFLGKQIGRHTPEYKNAMQKVALELGLPANADPFISFEEQRGVSLAGIQAKRDRGIPLTPDEETELSIASYGLGGAGGLSSIRRGTELDQRSKELGITGAEQGITIVGQSIEANQRKLTEDKQRIDALAAAGMTPGGFTARFDLGTLEQQGLQTEGQRISNEQGRQSILTAPLQRDLLRVQIEEARAQAAKYTAEATNPFTDEDNDYIAKLALDLRDHGIVPPQGVLPVSYIMNGILGGLPADEQAQFTTVYETYAAEARQGYLTELQNKANQGGSTTQELAARSLTAYYLAQSKGTRLNTSPEQILRWQAEAQGGTVTPETQRKWLFWNKTIFNWTPGQPGVPVTPQGPATDPGVPDPTSVQRQLDALVESAGSPEAAAKIILQQRDQANVDYNGLGDVMVSQFQTKYPNVPLEPTTIEAITRTPFGTAGPPRDTGTMLPTEAPRTPTTRPETVIERRVSYSIPPQPTLPQGLILTKDEQQAFDRNVKWRAELSTQIMEQISQGRQIPSQYTDNIRKIDNWFTRMQEEYDKNMVIVRQLDVDEARLEKQLVTPGANSNSIRSSLSRLRERRQKIEERINP